MGWYDNPAFTGNAITQIPKGSIGNKTFYAKWVIEFTYTGSAQSFTAPFAGRYKIETWGAQGGTSGGWMNNLGGRGSYTSGNISLNKNSIFYIYVGGVGGSTNHCPPTTCYAGGSAGYNGGGAGGSTLVLHEYSIPSGGGGATDIRLVYGNWNDLNSLKSRIMVSGGGGGACDYHGFAGAGLFGEWGVSQTAVNFGYGPNGTDGLNEGKCFSAGAGSGGGYYGSTSVPCGRQGTGGSSFISGHTGSVAITSANDLTPKNGCTDGTSNIECSKHYSGYIFTDTIMIDGSGYKWTTSKQGQERMPHPNGSYYNLGEGHYGNGYAKISYLGS